MTAPVPHVTAAELRILKVLWRIGSGTVRTVKEELERDGGDPQAYTTVMTLMNQLAAKGGLHVEKDRQPYLYRPALRRESVLAERVRQFISTVFDGQAGELVLSLVEEAELSPDDLKRIEAKIEAREKENAARRADDPDGGTGHNAGGTP